MRYAAKHTSIGKISQDPVSVRCEPGIIDYCFPNPPGKITFLRAISIDLQPAGDRGYVGAATEVFGK